MIDNVITKSLEATIYYRHTEGKGFNQKKDNIDGNITETLSYGGYAIGVMHYKFRTVRPNTFNNKYLSKDYAVRYETRLAQIKNEYSACKVDDSYVIKQGYVSLDKELGTNRKIKQTVVVGLFIAVYSVGEVTIEVHGIDGSIYTITEPAICVKDARDDGQVKTDAMGMTLVDSVMTYNGVIAKTVKDDPMLKLGICKDKPATISEMVKDQKFDEFCKKHKRMSATQLLLVYEGLYLKMTDDDHKQLHHNEIYTLANVSRRTMVELVKTFRSLWGLPEVTHTSNKRAREASV
ncbi:hypothetical protein ACEUA8_01480 [Aeromonas veronii]